MKNKQGKVICSALIRMRIAFGFSAWIVVYDLILVCNITVNELYERSKAGFCYLFNILWSFLR